MALIVSAAGRAGMATSAWLGEVGVRHATPSNPAPDGQACHDHFEAGAVMLRLMAAEAELTQSRRVLRNVGGNLNDVARYANSTGVLAAETGQVQQLVGRAVARVDLALADLGGLLVAARRAQLHVTRAQARPTRR